MMRTRWSTTALAAALLFRAADGTAQTPDDTGFAKWLGLETGDRIGYESASGDTVCAEIGAPRTVGGRAYVPLRGLPWPGLPTDSQVLVPLAGRASLSVVRTPGPRPVAEPLLPPGDAPIAFLDRNPPRLADRAFADGWYAFGGTESDPAIIAWVWCAMCFDAGTIVWFEKGRGVTRVENITIAGAERLVSVDAGCEPAVSRRCRRSYRP